MKRRIYKILLVYHWWMKSNDENGGCTRLLRLLLFFRYDLFRTHKRRNDYFDASLVVASLVSSFISPLSLILFVTSLYQLYTSIPNNCVSRESPMDLEMPLLYFEEKHKNNAEKLKGQTKKLEIIRILENNSLSSHLRQSNFFRFFSVLSLLAMLGGLNFITALLW